MKLGDFSELAKYYHNRAGYSMEVLKFLAENIKQGKEEIDVADIGAGTGKLTENLIQIGLKGYAIEPCDNMLLAGQEYLSRYGSRFVWSKATAEVTKLKDNEVDWILMGSSFHWTNMPIALKEFKRILKPGGYFTALWNPRDIAKSEIEEQVEEMIYRMLPQLTRVSSGSQRNIGNIEDMLLSGGDFSDLIFTEASHSEVMTKQRYIGLWKSVNDIQVKAGKEMFHTIMDNISNIIGERETVKIAYRTRAWTVRVCKS